MSMFEKATRIGLRFQTERGPANVEDVWNLSLKSLCNLAKKYKDEMKKIDEYDFLEEKETSEEDELLKLRFDIVLHMINTKRSENKSKLEESAKKEEINKIKAIIARKQDAALENMSVDDLMKKLDEMK